jgi:RES domain
MRARRASVLLRQRSSPLPLPDPGVLVFRHADRRLPFLWEGAGQPGARWNLPGVGPVHYFADTPEGAWAEFLRHEEITRPEDLETIARAIWAVEVPDDAWSAPDLPVEVMTGGPEMYDACRAAAGRLRDSGASGLRAPSAALRPGQASGWRVEGGLQPGPRRDGVTHALFGARPDLVGWLAALGRPDADLLRRVRPQGPAVSAAHRRG